jgi:glycosyltransferase involved in cell wall biosynthesis
LLFRKKHFIILHGTECNNYPEFNYGYLRKPFLFKASHFSIKNARLLLPVSESLVFQKQSYYLNKFSNQGFTSFYKNIDTPYQVIYNGIDSKSFQLINKIRDKKTFISISNNISSENSRILKGIDLIIGLAKANPNYSITLVGNKPENLKDFPQNITFTGFIHHNLLKEILNNHAFYLQLSITEGFGLALCEAMACGCIPIVSDVGIMPKISNNLGYVLPYRDLNLLDKTVKQAISEYEHKDIGGVSAHAIRNFSLDKRKDALLKILS